MTLRVGFAGTPAFASSALAAIADAGFTIPLVLTRPDKPKGRGLRIDVSDVGQQALSRGFPLLRPASLRSLEAAAEALAHPLDVLVVAAYGLILPRHVLDWPRYGCLNIHASRLPRWRGAAPIQRAIQAGDRVTGISIMRMDAGLDTGPVVDARDVVIAARETAGSLHDKLASLGAAVIVDVLHRLRRDRALVAVAQSDEGATYAAKIGRSDARIDWRADAEAIDRLVRALDPAPGAVTALDGALLKIWRAEPVDVAPGGFPGSIVRTPESLLVACGRGTLRVLEVQPAGGKRMTARAFAVGRSLAQGCRFVPPNG